MTGRHYLDPGPRPDSLGPCICADWFAEGEADHLPDCPRQAWACRRDGYRSYGPTCRHCGAERPAPAPEGW